MKVTTVSPGLTLVSDIPTNHKVEENNVKQSTFLSEQLIKIPTTMAVYNPANSNNISLSPGNSHQMFGH
jgi:hypothetical protein